MADMNTGGGYGVGPRAYLEARPTAQTVKLGGRYINIQLLAEENGLDHGYVSRIVNGKRTPSIDYLTRIAAALKMERDELLFAIALRKDELHQKWERIVGQSA